MMFTTNSTEGTKKNNFPPYDFYLAGSPFKNSE